MFLSFDILAPFCFCGLSVICPTGTLITVLRSGLLGLHQDYPFYPSRSVSICFKREKVPAAADIMLVLFC